MNESYIEMAKSSYKPKIQAVTSISQQFTAKSDITSVELSRLESMSNADLIALVKRMACQCGLVAMMTEDEREQALFDVLATKGIKAMDVPAIKEYFDRKKGKAAQSISIDATVKNTHVVMTAEESKQKWLEIENEFKRRTMIDVTPATALA